MFVIGHLSFVIGHLSFVFVIWKEIAWQIGRILLPGITSSEQDARTTKMVE
ncbi:MAG: hypothetical protein F6K31_33285 [Symploca sp. SIO2G7]|nr:hypothetical protein [Symploca sp. SIO2G7]